MSKVRNLLTKAEIAMRMRAGRVSCRTERGDHLLEVLGTIIIAVVILILFKGTIVNIFTNALNNTSTSVTNLFSNAVGNTV